MKDEEIVKIAAVGFIAIVVAPIVIGATVNLVSFTYGSIANTVNKISYHRRICKGLKDGSITEIDGKYYEVCNVEES